MKQRHTSFYRTCALLVGLAQTLVGCADVYEPDASGQGTESVALEFSHASATRRPDRPAPPRPPCRGRACPPTEPPPCNAGDSGTDAATTPDAALPTDASSADAGANDGAVGDAATPDAAVFPPACQGAGFCKVGTVPAKTRDMVHDAKRNLLYLSTVSADSGVGAVLTWDLRAARFLEPILTLTGGQFLGIDLSPDERMLAVADLQQDGTHNWIHVFDLETRTARKLSFPLDFYEGGTYTLVFLDDQNLLVSSTFQGSGWVPLRKLNLATGETVVVGSVMQSTMLTASADGSAVAFAESNNSGGPFGTYDVATATLWHRVGMGGYLYEVCIARDASQIAIPTTGGLYVFDAAHNPAVLGGYPTFALGCVYSPTSDLFYVAWQDYARLHPSVEAYDANTLALVAAIDVDPNRFDSPGGGAFGGGRMKTSRDGGLLFVSELAGVGIYNVGGR